MKKSQLKQLIREVITEVQAGRINASDRKKISDEMHKYPVLGGNEKVHNPDKAIKYVAKALDDAGFSLDMVTGDILLGDKGQRLLPFSKAPQPDRTRVREPRYITHDMALDAGDRSLEGSLYDDESNDYEYGEPEPITNSRISFSWEVTSVSPTNSLDKKFEVIAYVT
jgi:hypothetical protein